MAVFYKFAGVGVENGIEDVGGVRGTDGGEVDGVMKFLVDEIGDPRWKSGGDVVGRRCRLIAVW